MGNVVYATIVYDATDTAAFVEAWADARRVLAARADQLPHPRTRRADRTPRSATRSSCGRTTTPARRSGRSSSSSTWHPSSSSRRSSCRTPRPWPRTHGQHTGGADSAARGGLVEHVTPELAVLLGELVAAGDADMVQLRAVGGAVNDLDPAATAYAHRTQNFSLLASARGSRRAQIDAWWDRLAPHLRGVYLSFETNQSPARVVRGVPARDARPDRRLKALYDPEHVFDGNFGVAPLASERARATMTS